MVAVTSSHYQNEKSGPPTGRCLVPNLPGRADSPRMFQVLGCITQQHDLRLVVLAGVLCLFACATAMSLVARARATQDRARTMWLAGAGVVAGCGIWSTHF